MSQSPTATRRLFTPFNVIAALILLGGLPLAFLRFTQGLASVTEASDTSPWGALICFNLLCGVALSASGYVIASAVYLFGMKEYKPVLRPAVLVGFIGYFFVVVALLFDVGRPWRLPYPMIVSFGVTSVLFLVAWHVALYLATQFVEFCPAIFEWLGWKRWRKVFVAMTIGATIFGVVLSTLHQSALGALFLIAPTKVHPLWYSPFLPLFFFVSSIVAGMSMVIFEGTLSRRIFRGKVDTSQEQFDKITIGLGKGACITLAVYFAIKVIGIAHGGNWHLLSTPMGHWFLVELLGFVFLPCYLFMIGFRERRPGLIRFTAVLTIIGIIINRLNVSAIGFNWKQNVPLEHGDVLHFVTEIWISIAIVTVALISFRWIVNRMPVHREHPDYKGMH